MSRDDDDDVTPTHLVPSPHEPVKQEDLDRAEARRHGVRLAQLEREVEALREELREWKRIVKELMARMAGQ